MNKEILNNKHFKAKDIYSLWSKHCKEAGESISILSPYVDNTVKNILSSKQIDDFVQKSVYTRIDSDTIFDKPYQIRALINCKKIGINIFQIQELHAKALIIDNKYISIGSQNFTSAGRKNKETSMMSKWEFTSSEFLNLINFWMENAEEIDIEYLLKLESKLKKFRLPIIKLRQEHEIIFNEISEFERKRKQQELLNNILILKSQTKTSFASEYIFLTKTYIDNWVNPITTYLVDSGRDLRKWKVQGTDDSTSLERLKYYPCVNTTNNSIAYVRLTKTRISFYLTDISLGWYQIKEKDYHLSIRCPQENPTIINYQFILYGWQSGENVLNFYFNGANFKFVNGQFNNKSDEKEIFSQLINNNEEINKLIKRCFKGLNMETIGRSITNYFDGWWYKLYIVEYLENPIIIAEKQK